MYILILLGTVEVPKTQSWHLMEISRVSFLPQSPFRAPFYLSFSAAQTNAVCRSLLITLFNKVTIMQLEMRQNFWRFVMARILITISASRSRVLSSTYALVVFYIISSTCWVRRCVTLEGVCRPKFSSVRVNSGIGGKYKRDSHPPFLAVTSLRLIFRSSFSEPFIHFLSDEVFASICT